MALQRNREEVVNTQLAILISTLGVTADAETIHVHGKHRPDVLFELRGLRVVIEGKFADHPNAEQVVLDDARKRVRSGIAHISAAVVYPVALRNTRTTKMLDVLRKTQLKYRIVAETHETEDWFEGSPASLMDALRHSQEALTKDDIVEQTAKSLSVRLDGVAKLWMGQKGPCDRLSEILGLTPPRGEKPENGEDRRETAAKVSALVLANAFIFQEQLAQTDGRVTSLRKLEKQKDLVGSTAKHWNWIWENINYVPIFQLGERVLNELPAAVNSEIAARALLVEAMTICSQQAALRHDLMGRIYHWLLHHAKYLGTYYTSVSAATLLLKLTIAAKWEQDFGDPAQLANFKIADLACGTGTLLMASAQAIADAYIRVRADRNLPLEPKDMSTLHRALMENVLHGYDVLPSAVHLTASTLAMLAPEVAFVRMGLFVMPLGMDHGIAKLGSLDFLSTDSVKTQMALDYSQIETVRTGAGFSQTTTAELPKLDLCVMNPPFVRSVGGNLLFGSLPDERGRLQKELKRRVKQIGASATAGLGSVFVALADRWLKNEGRLAFVLPAALASGEAWGDTRQLISDRYHLETVVSSQDAERQNFSENTDLSELLFIARKRSDGEPAGRTKYINLWRNPRSIHESIDLANRILQASDIATVEGEGVSVLSGPSGKLGEMVSLPPAVGEGNWYGALFAQTELIRMYRLLSQGTLRIPGIDATESLPLCRLDALGDLGPDRARIHEGFNVTTTELTPYPAFWGHESEKVRTIAQEPNAYLAVNLDSPRGPNYGPHLWERAGRLLLVERLWPITHRVLAVGFGTAVLGNTWWALQSKILTEEQEKALLLWLNSSLALLLYFGRRVVTRSAWMQMKQPGWQAMPVLDVRTLSSKQLALLDKVFTHISGRDLTPLAQIKTDSVRSQIDLALSRVLKIPNLAFVRDLLDREPGLTAKGIAVRVTPSDLANEVDDGQDDLDLV
jgi:N-6 DNA Methylase